MKGFGVQGKIVFGNRNFKVHSGYHIETKMGISEVFEDGHFLYRTDVKYPTREKGSPSASLDYIKQQTRKLHDGAMNDLNTLFKIHERLKMVNQANPYFRLGKVFYVKNILNEAIENLEKAIRLQPDLIKTYKLLGLAYIKKGQFTKASEVFNKALRVKPDYPDLLNGLGVTFTKLSKFDKATAYFQKSLQIKPGFHEAHFNLGLILFLSSINESGEDAEVVLPARIIRSLNEIRENELYDDSYWQDQFDQILKIISTERTKEIKKRLLDFQLLLAVRENLNITMDMFFLKFMYGGKELSRSELDFYETAMKNDENVQGKFADYWNEMGVIHLIQCREYFKKATNCFSSATDINPKYTSAKKSKELMSHGEKGLLILLRAILK